MHLCDLNLLNQTYFLVWCLRNSVKFCIYGLFAGKGFSLR